MATKILLQPLHTDLNSYSETINCVLPYARSFPFAYLVNSITYRNLSEKIFFTNSTEKVQNLRDRVTLLKRSTVSGIISMITVIGLSILGVKSLFLPWAFGFNFVATVLFTKDLWFSNLRQQLATAELAQSNSSPLLSPTSAKLAPGKHAIGHCNDKHITAWEENGCCYISIHVKDSVFKDRSQQQFLDGLKSPPDQIKATLEPGFVHYQLADDLPAIEKAKFWDLIDEMQDTTSRWSSDWPKSNAIRWYVHAALEGKSEAQNWIRAALKSQFKGDTVREASFNTYAPFLKLGIVDQKGLEPSDIETLKKYLENGFSYQKGGRLKMEYGRSYTAYILGDPFIAQKIREHTLFDPISHLTTLLESKMADCKKGTAESIDWIKKMFNSKLYPLPAYYQPKTREAVWSTLSGCDFNWKIGRKEVLMEKCSREAITIQLKTKLQDDTLQIDFDSSTWFKDEVLILLGKDISGNTSFNKFFHKEYKRQFAQPQPETSTNCLVIKRANWKEFLQLIAPG